MKYLLGLLLIAAVCVGLFYAGAWWLSLKWYWMIAVVLGLWLFGGLVLRGVGAALSTPLMLLGLALLFFMDVGKKNQRARAIKRDNERSKKGY